MHNSPVKTTARYLYLGALATARLLRWPWNPKRRKMKRMRIRERRKMKRMRIRKRSKRRKSSNRLKNQLPKLKGRKQTQAKDTTKDFQREKTEAKGQSQRKCQGQKGEDTKGEERKEEQKGRHPCTFQKACCQRWYQRPSLQAPVWGARSERRG